MKNTAVDRRRPSLFSVVAVPRLRIYQHEPIDAPVTKAIADPQLAGRLAVDTVSIAQVFVNAKFVITVRCSSVLGANLHSRKGRVRLRATRRLLALSRNVAGSTLRQQGRVAKAFHSRQQPSL